MANFTLTENFGTYQGSTDYVLDGSTANTWRCDAQASSGKYILVTSDQLIHVNSVTYTTGQSSEVFGSGTYLQVSEDGSSFEDVGQFNGSTPLTFSVNKDARHIRVYCKSGSGYVSISELAIDYSETGSGGGSSGEKKTGTFTPAVFDSDHNYSSGSNTGNPIGAGHAASSYAQFYLQTGSRAQTYFSYSFDLSSIPENAVIKSVSCQVKAYTNGTNNSRVATRQVQLYSGSTAKGSAYNVDASTTAFNVPAGNWTREELGKARLRFNFVRGTSYTTSNYYVRFYGATLTVEYELPAEEDTGCRMKKSGKYRKVVKVFRKEAGKYQQINMDEVDRTRTFICKD